MRLHPSTRLLQSVMVAGLLMTHAALLAWSAHRQSPVTLEIGHLPAGIRHWQFREFSLYRVNPPLVRMIAALPVLCLNPKTDWRSYSIDPWARSETWVGIDFANANGLRTFWLYTVGRWACIPFSLIGAMTCFRWARDLYGAWPGLVAMALWCFSPDILGHGSLMMPDVASAALGTAATYSFWHWLKRPTWKQACISGTVLGIAQLTKLTLVLLYPIWLLLWCAYRVRNPHVAATANWRHELIMLVSQFLLSLYVLNLGYGFEGSFQRLGDYRLQSRTLAGQAQGDGGLLSANRGVGAWLGSLPIPLPKNYVQGIDTQKADFETGMRSYLRGEWKDHGWWYFYLYGLAVKLPLGTWALVALALVASILPRGSKTSSRDEMVLVVPMISILAFVSSQAGFSSHLRYALPSLPFLFIWASKAFEPNRWPLRCAATAALAWSVGSSLYFYPQSLSYFNELVGGPAHGHECLLDSAVAWGQDLLDLKRWCERHPEARPLYVASSGFIDPRLAGIECQSAPLAPDEPLDVQRKYTRDILGPLPGWFAVDVNLLHGPIVNTRGGEHPFKASVRNGFSLKYFQRFKAVDRIGFSMLIFHLTPQDANNEREALGLPLVPD